MTRIILSGCFGRMGGVITGCVKERSDCEIVAGVDIGSGTADFPVYKSFADVQESADVLIDFSHPSALDGILSYVTEKKIPAVMATTGYTPAQVEKLKATSGVIPLFFSANMSIGVNLIAELAAKAARVLEGSFDVEIVRLFELKPTPCNDCGYCKASDGCSKKDLDEFMNHYFDADLIVIASPVYLDAFPAPMKALFDRFQRFFCARLRRHIEKPIEKPKQAVTIAAKLNPSILSLKFSVIK